MKCGVKCWYYMNLNYIESLRLLVSQIDGSFDFLLVSQIDDAIAGEHPFCGDLMIREISLPFILPEEDQHQHVVSWEIKPNVGSQRSIPLAVWFGICLHSVNFFCSSMYYKHSSLQCDMFWYFNSFYFWSHIFSFYFAVGSLIFWLPYKQCVPLPSL